MNHDVLAEVLATSKTWIEHFNSGDVDHCVAGYLPDAEMKAAPMGEFQGTEAIDAFWRPFVGSGATDLQYSKVWVKQVDETTVHLGAEWSMNVGRGVITLEEWVKTDDGSWKLARDHFEVQEQFS
ncbi:MAG: nuclear transport factor 2 family protein [Acidobacteriota bacterium]